MLFGMSPPERSWRGVQYLLIAYFGAFLLAGALAPTVYHWIHNLRPSGAPFSFIQFLQEQPLSRIVDRIRLLFVVFSLFCLIWVCRLWGRFGFDWKTRGVTPMMNFLLLGMVCLLPVLLGQYQYSSWFSRNGFSPEYLIQMMLLSLVGALLIGWVEEAIFRGLILRMFYTAVKPFPATILSALFYAIVHFKKPPWPSGEEVYWFSGIPVAAGQSLSFIFTVEWLPFLNLFLTGVFLNLLFLRTQSLLPCMGFHAGLVFIRNYWGKLVEIPSGESAKIWGTERVVDGFVPLIILVLLLGGTCYEWVRKQRRISTSMEMAS